MTTTIIRGLAADGGVVSGNSSYSTARSGSNFQVNTNANTLWGNSSTGVGQESVLGGGWFNVGEAFIAFDIGGASIPSEDSIIDVALQIRQFSGTSVAFDVEARDYDWGATLTTGDWVAGDDLDDHDLLATLASSTATNTTRTFTPSGSALIAHVEANRTGTSRMLLNSSRHRNGDQPSTVEHLLFGSADAPASSNRPTLVIEHEEAHATDGALALTLGISGTARKVSGSTGALHLDLAASDDATKTAQTDGQVALTAAVEAEALAHKLTVGELGLGLDIAGTAEAGGVSGIIALVLDIAATAVKRAEATGTVALVLDVTQTPAEIAQLGAALVIDRGCSLTVTKAAQLDPARTVDRGRPLTVQLFMRRARLPVTGFELTHPGDRTIDLPLEVSPIGNQFELT